MPGDGQEARVDVRKVQATGELLAAGFRCDRKRHNRGLQRSFHPGNQDRGSGRRDDRQVGRLPETTPQYLGRQDGAAQDLRQLQQRDPACITKQRYARFCKILIF